jgi:hypothetical protein
MPTAVKTKKPVAEAPKKKVKAAAPVEEEAPAKKKVKSADSKNGKVTTTKKKTVEPVATKKKKTTTTHMSARDVVLKVLLAGAPKNEVKARAKKLAAEDGTDVSFKTFDVSFFIKYMVDKKGYELVEKKSGAVQLIAPKKAKA